MAAAFEFFGIERERQEDFFSLIRALDNEQLKIYSEDLATRQASK